MVSSIHNFGIVELKDGRWSTAGEVHYIEKNRDEHGLPCLFLRREDAVRAGAARAIRLARAARYWGSTFDRMKGSLLIEVVNYYRDVVARETGKPDPTPLTYRDPPLPEQPPPVSQVDGLPLFSNKAKGAT